MTWKLVGVGSKFWLFSTPKRMPLLIFRNTTTAWFSSLRDKMAAKRVQARIRRAELGNFGDCEPVGAGVSEMRIHVGPGYRAYYTRRGAVIYLLLLGGDKSSQKRDIKRAIEMARALDKE